MEFDQYLPKKFSIRTAPIYAAIFFKAMGVLEAVSSTARYGLTGLPIETQAACTLLPAALSCLAAYSLWKFKSYGLYALGASYVASFVSLLALFGYFSSSTLIFGTVVTYLVYQVRDELSVEGSTPQTPIFAKPRAM